MSKTKTDPNVTLEAIASGDFSVLDTLARMIEPSVANSGLDPETFMIVRIAALAAVGAAPASWLMNLKVSGEAGVTPERVVGTLVAIAPVVGAPRIVSAASSIVQAMGLEEALIEDSNKQKK